MATIEGKMNRLTEGHHAKAEKGFFGEKGGDGKIDRRIREGRKVEVQPLQAVQDDRNGEAAPHQRRFEEAV